MTTRHRAKLLALPATLLIMIVGVNACSRGGSNQPTTLRIIGEAVSTVDAIEEAAKQYEAETGIRIVVEKYEYETALQKSTLDLTSQRGHYDIILQYAIALGKFASQGHLYPVEELKRLVQPQDWGDFQPEKDLFPSIWSELSWHNSTCYGYPFAANTMYLWYRRDLLSNPVEQKNFQAKYGYALTAPTTWSQYNDVAEFFTRPSKNLYGTTIQGKRHPAVWYEWLNFAFSFGGGVMRKQHGWQYGPIIINSPETTQATEFYRNLLKYSPPGATNYTWDDALTAMQQGRIALAIMWSDAVAGLEDPKASLVAGRMGYGPPPAGPNGSMAQIAGGSYFVSRYSKHPKEAMQFILWSMQKDNQVFQQLHGGSSAVRAVYSDPKVRKIPYSEAQFTSLSKARYMTDSIPETEQVSDTIQITLSEILTNKRSVRSGLDQAALSIHQMFPDKCPLAYPPTQ